METVRRPGTMAISEWALIPKCRLQRLQRGGGMAQCRWPGIVARVASVLWSPAAAADPMSLSQHLPRCSCHTN